jgi:hypothetical protein
MFWFYKAVSIIAFNNQVIAVKHVFFFSMLMINTIYKKRVCGHPFNLVDSAISATPVADKCNKNKHTAMQSP